MSEEYHDEVRYKTAQFIRYDFLKKCYVPAPYIMIEREDQRSIIVKTAIRAWAYAVKGNTDRILGVKSCRTIGCKLGYRQGIWGRQKHVEVFVGKGQSQHLWLYYKETLLLYHTHTQSDAARTSSFRI